MSISASSLLPELPLPSKRQQSNVESSTFLPSLRRPPKRTNHLRRKLLETLKPSTHHPITKESKDFSHSTLPEVQEEETQRLKTSEVSEFLSPPSIPPEVTEDETQKLQTSEVSEVLSIYGNGSEKGDFLGVFLTRSLLLVGFFALQAAIAVWFLREDVDVKEGAKEREALLEGGDLEFRKKVMGIQKMAKEVRELEGKKGSSGGERDGREGKILGEVKKKVGKMKKREPPGKTHMEIGKIEEKASTAKSLGEDHPWWLKLSYVMAIFLHRGSDRKEFRGLYSLKFDVDSSFTVMFQDRSDATNFSYLLEAFFENLEDFSADVVPLSSKELHDAVRLDSLKVFVVKKGQLRLYAGQPLAEAEMQLRSIMD